MSCTQNKSALPEEAEEFHVYEYGICTDSLVVEKHLIQNGDNLSSIFSGLGISASSSDSIFRLMDKDILDPARLRAGMTYATMFRNDTDSSLCLQYIVFAKSRTDHAVFDFTGDTVRMYEHTKPIIRKQKYLEATVSSSLWNDIKSQGESPILAMALYDIYAWQIDFFDIKKGDSFKVIYDVVCIDDTIELDLIDIRGAVFSHKNDNYVAISFEQDSTLAYFDEKGGSLQRAFLKAPLDFFRITSRFSNSRYHPVLKRHRAHHGVDYAAPVGTPVKTIGDGVVIARAYQAGGAGNYLKIKHNSSYTTSYMHLNRFAKGIGVGSKVRQGDIIGYVGSTGLSTGPHLDFRVHKDGTPINPLKMESPPSHPVRSELKDSFNLVKANVLAQIDSLSLVFIQGNNCRITENPH